MPNLKQGTLSFATAKRTNSVTNGKSQKNTSVAVKRNDKRVETPVEPRSDERLGEVVDISSSDEGTAVVVPVKRTRASTKSRPSSGTTKRALSQPPQSEKQNLYAPANTERKHLDVEDKAGRYRKYYNEVRFRMGHIPPVHSEGQNKIHQMLRSFDMTYEFGPCVGMTRLERWERAETLGLNPPVEVRDILLTKEGVEKSEYAQCVLYDEV